MFEITILLLSALCTSYLSGVFGVGGGLLLLLILTWLFPIDQVFYIHAVTQLASNSIRFSIHRPALDYKFMRYFLSFSLLGFIPAIYFFQFLPQVSLKFLIYIYALVLMLLPKNSLKQVFNSLPNFLIPLLTPFVGLCVGAVGPFLLPYFYARNVEPKAFIANEALAAASIHILRLGAYTTLGVFLFPLNWNILLLPFILVPIVWIGTWLARKKVDSFGKESFYHWIRYLIAGLAALSIVADFLIDKT